MNFEELNLAIIQWAKDREIYKHSSAQAQLLKAVSELGELADAEVKGDQDARIDAIGDTLLCLVNYAALRGLTLTECLRYSYGVWCRVVRS